MSGIRLSPYEFRPSRLTQLTPSRLFGFADGVWTVVATLLVINLVVPGRVPPGGMDALLAHLKWDFVAYGIGFLQALAGWSLHHRLAVRTRAVDQWLVILVGLTLMLAVLVPFSTQVLARSFEDKENLRTAMMFVSVIGGVSTALFLSSAMYAYHRGLLIGSMTRERYRWTLGFSLSAIGGWAAAVVVSSFAPWVALVPVVWGYASAMLPLQIDTFPVAEVEGATPDER